MNDAERKEEYLIALERLVTQEKRKLRNDTIEECARVAENWQCIGDTGMKIAAAIRALKDKV